MVQPRIWIDNIKFNDGNNINISQNDIIVFVGPNNAGKSLSLKEISNLIRAKGPTKIIKSININKFGSLKDLNLFVENNSYPGKNSMKFSGFRFNIMFDSQISSGWLNINNGLDNLSDLFINILSTEDRLKSANPPSNIKLTSEAPQHPIHFLQKNDLLELQFSSYFRQAFGTDLIVHRNAGNEVPLYVGERPIPKQGEDRVSSEYIKELEKLNLLHQQGDGMRSFMGVLLNAFISHYSILFIDEPEAFLHPPQARLLGKMLAKNLPSQRQLFISTHNEYFLKGLLDSNIKNLKVIRIQRNQNINDISILNSDDINEIWNDSLLRHSNILDGLFHSKVVICESDSDSRFYSAMLSALFDDSDEIAPDLLFINVGGKHRIPVAIKALKKLNVPIKVVSDFDVLNNQNPLRNIYEDLGGTWSDIEKDWRIVKIEIESKRPEFLTVDAKEEINKIFSEIEDRIFPANKISEVQRVLKKVSAWTEAKSVGKSFIPSGNAIQAFERLQGKFKGLGFLIVEVGELEGFVRSVGNHGPKWINEVLVKDLKNDSELETARLFVKQFLD